ncbi:hypothetical protein TDB9533_02568 [Thalassocella blandensis]|nr:hypothetical protein TDB9533_02568 [Thalassocella blandensis]
MKTVFTYGSLMFPEVWEKIVRQPYQAEAAVLSGYERKQVKNAEYPAIYPVGAARQHTQVQGVVYFSVNSLDLKLLDDFEGPIYLRETVQISLNNTLQEAQAYVLRAKYRHLLSRLDWQPEYFKTQNMQAFIKRTLGRR